jgi:uncharacterized protein with PIN domain
VSSRNGRDRRRQHVYRRPKDRPGIKAAGSHLCPECGKWCYETRDDAEAAVRQAHPGATVHYYRCESRGKQWWHYTSMTAEQQGSMRAREAGDRWYRDDDTEDSERDDGQPEETVALRINAA